MSAKSKSVKYNVGDPVWAKMKGFPPWPGLVSEPTKELLKTPKKGYYCIFFFGTNNYAWIESGSISPYAELKEKVIGKNKSAAFIQACEAIEEYIKKGNRTVPVIKTSQEDAFDKLLSPPSTPRLTKPKKKDSSPSVADESVKKTPRSSVASKPGSGKKAGKRSSSLQSPVNGETPEKKTKKSSSDITSIDSTHLDKSRSPLGSGSPPLSGRESPESDINLGDSNEPVVSSSIMNTAQGEVSASHSSISIGIMGVGVIGSRIAKHLIEAGYKVVIWNRSKEKSQKFSEAGVEVARSPAELADVVDIIFSCVSDPKAAQACVLNSEEGLITADLNDKCYVEMATIDVDASRDLEDTIVRCGGRYLEAQIQGSKDEADCRELILICAGSRQAFDFCLPLFENFAIQSFFVGDTGKAVETNLLLQMFHGVSLGGLAEGIALGERANHRPQDIHDIIKQTEIYSQFMEKHMQSIIDCSFTPNLALKHLQKNINLGLLLGDIAEHPLPMTSSANEIYKHAKRLGYRDADVSAVYLRARF